MIKKTYSVSFFLTACLIFCFFLLTSSTQAQEQQSRPALLEQPMPDFSLPSYQGPEVRLYGLKGKNLMLIFPGGMLLRTAGAPSAATGM